MRSNKLSFLLAVGVSTAFLLVGLSAAEPQRKDSRSGLTPLDRYLQQAGGGTAAPEATPGSLFRSSGRLAEPVRDLRAFQPDDILTIIVSDRASAVSRGGTSSQRDSSASASIPTLFGNLPPGGALTNLAGLSGKQKLEGQGETSRNSSLFTTLSARVVSVLPNGNLVVEGAKQVSVNSERQTVRVRGIVRWNDISPSNTISSDRLAQLEISIDGRGVVNDAVRRPNFLYRLLLGLLPF